MFTVTFVLYESRSPGTDRDKALEHWRTTHADLVQAVPGVRKYVQNAALRAPDGSASPFLGVAELAFDDDVAFRAAAGSPEFAAAIADVANFADPENLPTAVIERYQVV